MEIHEGRFRFTIRDVLVLFAVVALLLGILTPLIQHAREQSRRAQCINNMRQLGLMFCNFECAYNRFPASSGITRNVDGSVQAVDGWSCLVYLLPYECDTSLYDTLDLIYGKPLVEPAGARGTPHADAANQRRPEFLCPANRNSAYVSGPGPTGWVTNYKAMGATHVESLSVASPLPGVPLYPGRNQRSHPDGACFPGSGLRLRDFADGTAHTILAAETMDPTHGIWTVGAECTLVGLPSRQPNEEGEMEPLRFEKYRNAYYAPAGFDGTFDDAAPAEIRRLNTYLAFDFQRATPGAYVGLDPRNTYGPSSAHPGVVNHLFVDGSVRAISKEMDFAYYMFLITRDGREPTWVGSDSSRPDSTRGLSP